MPRRVGAPGGRVLAISEGRFANALRATTGRGLAPTRRPPRPPDVVVDVVRAEDLVACTLEGYDVELIAGEDPHLRPVDGADGVLVLLLPSQHLAEHAIYEEAAPAPDPADPSKPSPGRAPADPATAEHHPPIDARPARASRVVLRLPAGDRVPFSSAGILAALGRLEMVVHPLALPRDRAIAAVRSDLVLHLPGDRTLRVGPDDAALGADRGSDRPDPTTVEGLAVLARDQRRARTELTGLAGTVARLGGTSEPDALLVRFPEIVLEPGWTIGGGGRTPEVPRRPDPVHSREPAPLETSLEAPYRLMLSPSVLGGWAHATTPVRDADVPQHVELWHSRLGVRREVRGEPVVDERASAQRIVRVVWARDRERVPSWRQTGMAAFHAAWEADIARTSLSSADRHMLVRQSAETWIGGSVRRPTAITPRPVDARSLWLSSLGAWLDLHGDWDTTPYAAAGIASILSWDHVAPMGRDQFVRVVYPGYLFPFGHAATLVKITERKMRRANAPVAGLYQRMFLVVGEPTRTYAARDLPLTRVRVAPLVSPTIREPSGAVGDGLGSYLWPRRAGTSDHLRWILHAEDHEGRPVRLVTPLLWVAAHHQGFAAVDQAYAQHANSRVPAAGQDVAFAPAARGGDTVVPTTELRFAGKARTGTSTPRLLSAQVHLPAAERLAPLGPVTISYHALYRQHGFDGGTNAGEVWAAVAGTPTLAFGGSPSAGSDKAGGFVQPDLPIRGLSRRQGAVGDPVGAAGGTFVPAAALAGALPKLFGLVPLLDLIEGPLDLADGPAVVSEALDRVEAILRDLERARGAAEAAVVDADRLVKRAVSRAPEAQASAQSARAAAVEARTAVTDAASAMIGLVPTLGEQPVSTVAVALQGPRQQLELAVARMRAAAPLLPPLTRTQLRTLADALDAVPAVAELAEQVVRFVNGLGTNSTEVAFRYEWTPKLHSWPAGSTSPTLEVAEDSLVIAVEGRASGAGPMGIEVLAELRDVTLHLLPGTPLVRFRLDHLSFRSGSAGKTEVDVVLGGIEFVGLLGFVETIRQLIPFDGFSDPPSLDVSPEGVTAGFSLALPNVAIGVFNLSNISLGADLRVPFLGDVVTIGFDFCSRERPFTLAVLFIGGGGWFGLRVSPDGLDVLELGLEAGAVLAVDFGVASGSISAMIGIYLRLEGDGGSLTGYFRLRGEVDVLGLISASIELSLALHYDFPTGKMIGEASLTVKVEVLLFSGSVTIRCQRRFAGSNGDPDLREVLAVGPDGTSSAWSAYCAAFAEA
jgi:hypothetical protein